jgi:hypothetical protein
MGPQLHRNTLDCGASYSRSVSAVRRIGAGSLHVPPMMPPHGLIKILAVPQRGELHGGIRHFIGKAAFEIDARRGRKNVRTFVNGTLIDDVEVPTRVNRSEAAAGVRRSKAWRRRGANANHLFMRTAGSECRRRRDDSGHCTQRNNPNTHHFVTPKRQSSTKPFANYRPRCKGCGAGTGRCCGGCCCC